MSARFPSARLTGLLLALVLLSFGPPPAAADDPVAASAGAQDSCALVPAPVTGAMTYQVEIDHNTTWQPLDGEILVKITDDKLPSSEIGASFCWPYDSNGKRGHWINAPQVRLVSRSSTQLQIGVTVPRGEFADAEPSLISTFNAWRAGAPHTPYDGWSLIPQAQLRIRTAGTDSEAGFEIIRPVGITTRWVAALLAIASAVFVGALLYLWACFRKIGGDPILRIISNRDGYASLSQLQLIVWTLVIGAGAIYVMALTGMLIDVPAEALTLLGISGVAGLGAQVAQARPPADPASATPDPLPAAILGLRALAPIGADALLLTWRNAPAGPEPVSYLVEYSDDGGNSWTALPSVDTPIASVTGLLAGTSYRFRVTPQDGSGRPGQSAPPISVMTAAAGAAAAPGVPGEFAPAAEPTASGVRLSWTAPATGAASYIVRYREIGKSAWSVARDPVTDATTAPVTGLDPASHYEFQVAAVSRGQVGPWSGTIVGSTARREAQWSDLVVWDGHTEVDVTRVQMLFFTAIAAIFVVLKIGNDSVIPTIPGGIMILMGISNGVYLSAKFLPGGR